MRKISFFLKIISVFVSFSAFSQSPMGGEAPRIVNVNGQKYGVYYSWSGEARANQLIKHGTYDAALEKMSLNHQAELAAKGIKTNNVVVAGLNVASNPVESAAFGGRNGPNVENIGRAKLVEVLVPESEIPKVQYNEMGEYFGDTKSWHTIDEPIKGSVIREFSGVGMTEAELKALPQKIASNSGVVDQLKITNSALEKVGKPAITKFPSVEYIEKQVVQISKGQPATNVPKVVPKMNLSKTLPSEQVLGEKTFRAGLAAEEEVFCRLPGVKTPTALSVNATLSTAVNVLGAASIVMAVIDPEKNPFSGPAVGVDCGEAEAENKRLICHWFNPVNPWDNTAYCQYLTKIVHTGRKQWSLSYFEDREICEMSWVQFSFNLDAESKSKFKSSGLLDKHGVVMKDKNGRSFSDRNAFLKYFQSEYKIKDPDFQEHSIPEKDPDKWAIKIESDELKLKELTAWNIFK